MWVRQSRLRWMKYWWAVKVPAGGRSCSRGRRAQGRGTQQASPGRLTASRGRRQQQLLMLMLQLRVPVSLPAQGAAAAGKRIPGTGISTGVSAGLWALARLPAAPSLRAHHLPTATWTQARMRYRAALAAAAGTTAAMQAGLGAVATHTIRQPEPEQDWGRSAAAPVALPPSLRRLHGAVPQMALAPPLTVLCTREETRASP